MKRFLLPLILFLGLAGFLYVGLHLDPHEVPSPLINKAAPAFSRPVLDGLGANFAPADMRGKVWLLNVWASWCDSCREEHAVLVEFSKTGAVPIVGLDYKDHAADARQWLASYGNPYLVTVSDDDGRVGIDYGVYGVPETYVIDKAGVIRYKQIGAVSADSLQQTILPLVRELQQ